MVVLLVIDIVNGLFLLDYFLGNVSYGFWFGGVELLKLLVIR